MIENKRFRYVEVTKGVDEHIIDYSTEPHFEYYTLKGATDKLNDLNDENKQLRFDFNEMKGLLYSLEDENEKLEDKNKELKEENEQLKQTIEEMINIFNDSGLDYCLSDEVEEILE